MIRRPSPDGYFTFFGESNLDGEFNSADLIAVFQAGEYQDSVAVNSTWATGDWNGDTEFDTRDLSSRSETLGSKSGNDRMLRQFRNRTLFYYWCWAV